jgi:YD repeat-containing protein
MGSPLSLTTYTYDSFLRLERRTTNRTGNDFSDDLLTNRFEYDDNDNVTVLIDDLGRRTVVTYDGRDQAASVAEPQCLPQVCFDDPRGQCRAPHGLFL